MITIFSLSSVLYLFLMTFLIVGIKKLNKNKLLPNTTRKVSICIAFYNEEKHLPQLLNSIKSLNSKHLAEFIFIDDQSEDQSLKILEDFKQENKEFEIKLIKSEVKSLKGKKNAISLGLKIAENEIILTTDADCILPKTWIETMLSYFDEETQMVCGAVGSMKPNTFLEKIFALEFSSLIVSGAASIGFGHSSFCNAANMGFRLGAYQRVKNKIEGQHLASGDDVFLLHSISKEYGEKSIKFAYNTNSVVLTRQVSNFRDFINQRVRWGSKSTSYKKIFPIFTALVVALINISLICLLIFGIFEVKYFKLFIVLFLLKLISDFTLLKLGKILIEPKPSILVSITTSILYPIYICITIFMFLFKKKTWK